MLAFFALIWNFALYFELSTLASPAQIIKIAESSILNESDFAILQGSQLRAFDANSTVALETLNSCILSSSPKFF